MSLPHEGLVKIKQDTVIRGWQHLDEQHKPMHCLARDVMELLYKKYSLKNHIKHEHNNRSGLAILRRRDHAYIWPLFDRMNAAYIMTVGFNEHILKNHMKTELWPC